MSARVLFIKRDGEKRSLFRNESNIFNNTRARKLEFIYHMT